MTRHPNIIEEVGQLFVRIFTNESNNDPVFVSFDVAHGNSKGAFSAIGASVLDLKYFKSWAAEPSTEKDHLYPIFWTNTYNFHYGAPGVNRSRKRSLFDGNVQKVSKCGRTAILRHIFSHPEEEQDANESNCCHSLNFQPDLSSRVSLPPDVIEEQGRPIIVVGHAIHSDLCSLHRAGFSIEKVAPVLAYLDTQTIARELYWKNDPSKNISLKELCLLMGFEPAKLHTCGNDAAYTLIVLLILAGRILASKQEGDCVDLNGIRRTLEQLVTIELASAKTARQKRKEIAKRDNQEVCDWAEHLDGESS